MLEALLARYGVLALFVGAGLEGETVVVIGGLLAHRGLFTPAEAISATAAGSFLADQSFFALGRRFRDQPWVRRLAARPAFSRALGAFERRPTGFVLAFRFLYGLRVVSPLAIGTTRLPAYRFVPLNAVAALTWATLFTTLGYVFGQGIEAAFGHLRPVEHSLLIGLATGLALSGGLWLMRHGRGASRRRARLRQQGPANPPQLP